MKKHIIITGKVQGVGFRYWLYKAAIQRNIEGWVRNNISGEVESLLIGNDENIDNLIKFYMDAMTGKFYVDDSQVHKIKARKLYGLEHEVEITISNQN